MGKTFKDLIAPRNENNVLIVDALNLGFRWKHRGIFDFAEDYLRTVNSLAKSYDCGKIIIAADWGSSTYRKNIFPEYKQNREDLRAEQTEKEAEDFKKFIEEYNNTLNLLLAEGYLVFKYKGVEADDIAAFIVKNREDLNIEKIWLISSDRDWDLLISENVSRFSYVTRKDYTLENWEHDFPVEEYITYKCLTGDKGDNVPGIDGIGPKRATSILQEYGNVFDIYSSCPIPGKAKFIQNLNNNCEQLLINSELMDLFTYCEEAIGKENIEEISSSIKEYMNERS